MNRSYLVNSHTNSPVSRTSIGFHPIKGTVDRVVDKHLAKSIDSLSESLIERRTGRFHRLNRKLDTSSIDFSPVVNKIAYPNKRMNDDFIYMRHTQLLNDRLHVGSVTPSLNQLNLYGKRERPSRFEQIGLFVQNNRFKS